MTLVGHRLAPSAIVFTDYGIGHARYFMATVKSNLLRFLVNKWPGARDSERVVYDKPGFSVPTAILLVPNSCIESELK